MHNDAKLQNLHALRALPPSLPSPSAKPEAVFLLTVLLILVAAIIYLYTYFHLFGHTSVHNVFPHNLVILTPNLCILEVQGLAWHIAQRD